MRARTKDSDGRVITVQVLGKPDRRGMYRVQLDSGCRILRHMSRLEMFEPTFADCWSRMCAKLGEVAAQVVVGGYRHTARRAVLA